MEMVRTGHGSKGHWGEFYAGERQAMTNIPDERLKELRDELSAVDSDKTDAEVVASLDELLRAREAMREIQELVAPIVENYEISAKTWEIDKVLAILDKAKVGE